MAAGTVYGLVASDAGVRSDPSKVLLDPAARDVLFPAGFRRAGRRARCTDSGRASRRGSAGTGAAPVPAQHGPPLVYEVHVRGFTRRRVPGPARSAVSLPTSTVSPASA